VRFSPLFLALTALWSAPAFTAEQDPARTLDTVTVSASRTGQAADTAPQTVVIIDRQAIEKQLRISGNS